MSKLPPLPEPAGKMFEGCVVEGKLVPAFSAYQMREYGQRYREAAFDEAADHCDKLQVYPATEPRHCAEDIRILKNE